MTSTEGRKTQARKSGANRLLDGFHRTRATHARAREPVRPGHHFPMPADFRPASEHVSGLRSTERERREPEVPHPTRAPTGCLWGGQRRPFDDGAPQGMVRGALHETCVLNYADDTGATRGAPVAPN